MFKPIATRLLLSAIALWLVSLAFFFATNELPGDFASVNSTRDTSIEELDQARRERDLYLPLGARYRIWFLQAIQGDFGRSWAYGSAIAPILSYRLGNTLILAIAVAALALPVALMLGIWSAVRLDSRTDRSITTLSLVGVSIPEFVLAYTLMYLITVKVQLLPAFTAFTRTLPALDFVIGIALPVLVLTITAVAPILRLTRASLINELGSPYIEMARAKGLRNHRVVISHALPNAIGPIAQAMVLSISNMLLGVVIIEYIFNYPGIGRLMVDAVRFRDVPMMMACTLVFAALYMLLNISADTIGVLSNPRLRFPLSSRNVSWSDFRLSPTMRIVWICGALAVILIAAYFHWRDPNVERPDVQIAQEEKWPHLFPPATDTRSELTVADLLDLNAKSVTPLHNSHFVNVGASASALEGFNGELRVPAFSVQRGQAGHSESHYPWQFPGFRLRFSSDGEYLIPHQRGLLGDATRNRWKVIPGPGRIWSEEADRGWSRAAFPFTLVHAHGNGARNGVAAFVYREKKISNLRVQIAQESAPGVRIDVWGQADVFYLPRSRNADDQEIIHAFQNERENRFNPGAWDALNADSHVLATFDGRIKLDKIAQSALLIDDTLYVRTCRTRLGPYPFCDEMRHSVYSVSKSLGALIAMLWLAQEYGETVFDEKVVDYLPLNARHNGWRDVTFSDALNMATGIGDLVPFNVRDEYIEVDGTRLARQIFNAEKIADKLWLMGEFGNYPWKPGDVFRYRTSDTMLLAAAMDAFLKSREGKNARLWDRLNESVFEPLGLPSIPVLETFEPDSRFAIPRLGDGMLLSAHEAAKLAQLIQNHGEHNGRQLLHRERTMRALSQRPDDGLPTGAHYAEGGEARYHMSLWRAPHKSQDGCRKVVPYMSGYGGNSILLLPNNTIALRFADGGYNDADTWDHWDMRNAADAIKPFCDDAG
ncbi:MAG: ABC transporter permease subunit [Pseudomonadota bacterium]